MGNWVLGLGVSQRQHIVVRTPNQGRATILSAGRKLTILYPTFSNEHHCDDRPRLDSHTVTVQWPPSRIFRFRISNTIIPDLVPQTRSPPTHQQRRFLQHRRQKTPLAQQGGEGADVVVPSDARVPDD